MVPWGHIEVTESTSIKEGSSARSLNVDGRVLKKGPWTLKEDNILVEYVKMHGEGNWNSVSKNSTLLRSGKSCRLRWINHLRPNLKKGAFTQEEQQMIIKMHARMGNKWAQMAAQLPGRTDNEIKNYWNTRIKKLQRAGLPIHPHNVYHQVSDESHQKRMISCGAQQHNEIFHADMALSYASEFPNIPINNMISHGCDSQGYGYMNPVDHAKQHWASGTSNSGCHGAVFNGHHPAELFQINSFGQIQLTNGLDYQHVFDPAPTIRIPTPFEGEIVCDGNSSATLKPELPSFQYAEPGDSSCAERPSGPAITAIDEHLESSPADVSLQSDCFSLWDDGYLKLLLHGTHAPRSGKRYLPEKYHSSSATTSGVVESSGLNLCMTEAKDYCDLISSSCSSAAATINEIMPHVVAGSFPEFPAPKAISGSHGNNGLAFAVSVEEDRMLSHSDFTRPDALLGECWMQGSRRTLDHSITSLLGEQFYNQHEPPPPEAAFRMQGLDGLDSCPWDRMPDACQILDLP